MPNPASRFGFVATILDLLPSPLLADASEQLCSGAREAERICLEAASIQFLLNPEHAIYLSDFASLLQLNPSPIVKISKTHPETPRDLGMAWK